MPNLDKLEKVFQRIESQSQKHIDDLLEHCSQPSVSVKKEGLERCADLVVEMMRSSGLRARIFKIGESAPHILGETSSKNSNHTLLLYNHYDVQPPEPLEEWESEPFSPRFDGQRIFARGVADNKGSLIARLGAIRTLMDLDALPVNVKFLAEGEEEVGSPRMHEFLENNMELLRSDGCLWEGGEKDMEGRPKVYLGMKGMLYLEFRAKTGSMDQHSMWAPVAPNPAWKLTWLLASMKRRNGKITIEGFYDKVKRPSSEESMLLRKIPVNLQKQKLALGLKQFVRDYGSDDFLQDLYFSPTFTICGFDSGYKGPGSKTVNPCEAVAKVDFRLVPDQRPDEIMLKVKTHMLRGGFDDVKVAEHSSCEPCRTSPNTPIVKTLLEAGRRVYAEDVVLEPNSPGSGPMSLVMNCLGIPVASGECVAHADSRCHAPNENIFTQDFIQGMKHVAATLIIYPTHARSY